MRTRRLEEMPIGTGPAGDVPYDRTGMGSIMPDSGATMGPGAAQPPVEADPPGMPRMSTDALSNDDLAMIGADPNEPSPEDLIGDQLSEAYNSPDLDPAMRAQIEEQQRLAALRMLGLA